MKRAIIIGLNYAGTEYELPDCEVDAETMERILKRQGVETTVVKSECSASWLLSHLINVEATRQTTKDTLYLYFSGHGTQFPDKTEDGETGEAICLYEKRKGIVLLKDNDLKAAIDRIPGTKIVVLDSCFSGGMGRDATPPIEGMQRKSLQYDPETMPFHSSGITRDVLRFAPQYYLFACMEHQLSYSTGIGGAFTLSIKRCAHLNYRTISKILRVSKIECAPLGQTPTAVVVGGSYSKRVI